MNVMRPKVIVLIGPQGSGKDTQAQILVRHFNGRSIVIGELLRQEAKKKSKLGRDISRRMTLGELIADAVVLRLIKKAIATTRRARVIIMNGYPRNQAQALELGKLLTPDVVLNLALPPALTLRRMRGRVSCVRGHTYNLHSVPPRKKNICDVDGLKLRTRTDDSPAAVKRRLQIYRRVTSKVLAHYRRRGLLITVDARPSVRQVTKNILQALPPL